MFESETIRKQFFEFAGQMKVIEESVFYVCRVGMFADKNSM